jgi:hypothetical protein
LSESYFVQDRIVSHGYKISQCKDSELMMLFRFLIPIFHPRKPTYIPVKWANTIIASWTGEREINWAFIMHRVIQDEVKALKADKLSFLPSYLARLYAYAECELEIEVDDRDVIKELYGTEDEDALTDEEEASSEKTEERSTEIPLEASGDTEEGDQSDYVFSVQTQSTDMHEPLMAAATRDSEVSKPQQSDYVSSVQTQSTDMHEPLMEAATRDSEVSKPQQSDLDSTGLATALMTLGEREEEGQKKMYQGLGSN